MGEGSLSLRETGDSADGLRERQETGGEGGAADSGSPARQVVGGMAAGSQVLGPSPLPAPAHCTIGPQAPERTQATFSNCYMSVCLSYRALRDPRGHLVLRERWAPR